MQLGQVSVDEVRLVQQVRFLFQAGIQLIFEQQAVNRERPKTLAVAIVQIGNDQIDQLRVVGTPQPLKQVPPPVRVERLGNQPVQRRVFEPLQVLILLERPLLEAGKQLGIELGREIRFAVQ